MIYSYYTLLGQVSIKILTRKDTGNQDKEKNANHTSKKFEATFLININNNIIQVILRKT